MSNAFGAFDYVDNRMGRYQTVVTAEVANRERLDGLELIVQEPNYQRLEIQALQLDSEYPLVGIDATLLPGDRNRRLN